MADEELELSVDASGAEVGVNDFLRSLERLPDRIGEILGRLRATELGDTNAFLKRGQDIGESFYRGLQAAQAGYSTFAGEGFGEQVLRNAGVTPQQLREYRRVVDQLNALRTDMIRAGDPIAAPRFDQRNVLGLPSTATIEQTALAYERAQARVLAAQQRVARVGSLTTNERGVLDENLRFIQGSPKTGYQWNEPAQHIARTAGIDLGDVNRFVSQTSGMPSEAQAMQFLQRSLDAQSAAFNQMLDAARQNVAIAATAPRVPEPLPASGSGVDANGMPIDQVTGRPLTQRQVGIVTYKAAHPDATSREVAEAVGGHEGNARKVISRYREVIDALAEEIRVIEATNRARRDYNNALARQTAIPNVRNSAYDRIDRGYGRNQFDFEPNEYLQKYFQDEEGNVHKIPLRVYNGQDVSPGRPLGRSTLGDEGYNQGSRFVRDQGGYERWFEQQELTWAERLAIEKEEAQARRQAAVRRRVENNRAMREFDEEFQTTISGRVVPRMSAAPIARGDRPLTREELTEAFGGPRGMTERFKEGFRGAGRDEEGRDTWEMAGQTARISLFYGAAYRALTLLQDALVAVTQETLQYQAALTDLSVATGRNTDQNRDVIQSLSQNATAAGFAPSTGVEVGWRALGLYNAAGSSEAEQNRVMGMASDVALRVARVSGGDPNAVNTQLAGALRSFGYGIDRLPELEDSITYIARMTGQQQTEVLGATANIATLGASAGFSPEQLMALVAQVSATTGQNAEGTAGQFRQVMSREFGAVAGIVEGFGADISGASNIEDLFQIASDMSLTQEQINAFTAGFGKGGSQQVAMVTLQNWDAIQGLVGGAADSRGIGQETFNKVMDNIGNRLLELGQEFLDFGVSLADSGILDWLVVLVEAARNVVAVGNELLGVLDMIPRPLRSVAFALMEVYAASLLINKLGVGGRLGALAQSITRGGERTAGQNLRAAGGGIAEGWRNFRGGLLLSAADRDAARELARDRTAGNSFQRMGMRAQGATGLTGLGMGTAAAGALLLADLAGSTYRNGARMGQLVEDARARSGAATTAEALREAAANARNAADEISAMGEMEVGDIAGLLPALIARMTSGGARADLVDQEAINVRRAEALEQARSDAADSGDVFRDWSVEGLAASMEQLESRAFNATERLNFLNEAIGNLASDQAPEGAVARIRPFQRNLITEQLTQTAMGAREGAFESQQGQYEARRESMELHGDFWNIPEMLAQRRDADALRLSPDAQNQLTEAMRARLGAEVEAFLEDGFITQDEVDQLVRGAGEVFDANTNLTDAPDAEAIRSEFLNGVRAQWRKLLKQYTPEQIAADPAPAIAQAIAQAEMAASETEALSGSGTAGLQAQLDGLMASRAGIAEALQGGPGGFTDEDARNLRNFDTTIAVVRRNLYRSRLDDARALSDFNKSALNPADVFGRNNLDRAYIDEARRILDEELAANPDAAEGQRRERWALGALENQAGQADQQEALARNASRALSQVNPRNTLGRMQAELNNARTLAASLPGDSSQRAAAIEQITQLESNIAQEKINGLNAAALAAVDPRDNLGRIGTQMANLRRSMSGAFGAERAQMLEQLRGLQVQYDQQVVERANAMAEANVAGLDSGIRQAETALATAQRTLSAALPNTTEYYNALGSVRQAQRQLADAHRAGADMQRRRASDLTDPVEQAMLDLQQARENLEAARARGEGPDAIAQFEVAETGARNSAEAAAFQQRLSDVQVAEDLGRISHSAYMSYLQSEHDRLTAIAGRTRQQQEQLNQVDQLMKSAAEEMQGMWNIGDIDLPTVYEVRRAMGAGEQTSVADYSNSNNVVNINGANFDQVVDWLVQYMGGNAQVVRSAPRRV